MAENNNKDKKPDWTDAVAYVCVLGGFVTIFGGLGYIGLVEKNHEFEMEKMKLENAQKNKIHIQDLNYNKIPETFYVIGKDTAFVSIDGKHINDFLK